MPISQIMILLISIFIFSIIASGAPSGSFAVSKIALSRDKVSVIKIEAQTMILNDEDPKNNISFNETIIIKDFKKEIVSINISKENAGKYALSQLAKVNLEGVEYFVESDYITLSQENTISDLLYILFSPIENDIFKVVSKNKIDLEIIGLGRANGVISRIYGAKELNTYRKNNLDIANATKGDTLEEVSAYISKIKPQIWLNKDTFFPTRFIAKINYNNENIISDLIFKEYRVYANTFMFPRFIDVVHNERLFARTTIKSIEINSNIDNGIFNIKTDLKKRSFLKMSESFSDQGKKILQFIRQYR